MVTYPRHRERWQHIKGWKVYIIGIKYRASVEVINPEFYQEVRFIYENSGEYTEMPLNWFREVYRKVSDKGDYPKTERIYHGFQPSFSYRSGRDGE